MNKFSKMKASLLRLDDNLPIYIAGHIKPDQDSVCSCLAIAAWLEQHGKKAFVLLNGSDKNIIDWQGGAKFLATEVTHEKYNFVALDLNEMKRLGDYYEAFKNAIHTINIDHHQGNVFEADETLSIPGISSTCEIIYEIIKPDRGDNLDKAICEQIYSGMMNDTNCFSRRLSENTLKIAQKLINAGIDYVGIIQKTFAGRTLYQFKALARVVDELKCDDGIYYAVVDKSREEFCQLSHNQIVKQIAEDLRKIEGIDIFLMLIKNGDTIVAKVMSNVSENADKLAAVFGGGGHKKEAGFTIKDTKIEEIISKAKEFLNK